MSGVRFADPAALGPRSWRKRDVALWAVLVLFLPVAFLGLVIQPNEYASWGGSGVDCDGPALVAFAVPAAVVYGLGGLLLLRRTVRRRSWGAGIAALACAALVAGLVANTRAANREAAQPYYIETCLR